MSRNVEQEHQVETQLGPLINSCVVPQVCASLQLACCQVSDAGPAAVPHITECYGALIKGEWSGVDTVVRTCVTVSATAAAGHRVLHMWVEGSPEERQPDTSGREAHSFAGSRKTSQTGPSDWCPGVQEAEL